MTSTTPPLRTWLVLRQTRLAEEERSLLSALEALAERSGVRVRQVLFGTASYDVDRSRHDARTGESEIFVLEEEARGRGISAVSGGAVRTVAYPELVRWLFDSEKVISFP